MEEQTQMIDQFYIDTAWNPQLKIYEVAISTFPDFRKGSNTTVVREAISTYDDRSKKAVERNAVQKLMEKMQKCQ